MATSPTNMQNAKHKKSRSNNESLLIANDIPPLGAELSFDDATLLPEWQLCFCANYEYARNSPSFREHFDKVLATTKTSSSQRRDYSSGNVWVFVDFLVRWLPDFPRRSWVEIEAAKRIELLEKIQITSNQPFGPEGFIEYGTPESYFEAISAGHKLGIADDAAAIVAYIDFRESDNFIIEQFAKCLSAKRNKLTTCSGGSQYNPIVERRGSSNNPRQMAGALRDLERYRKGVSFLPKDTRSKLNKRLKAVFTHFNAKAQRKTVGMILTQGGWPSVAPIKNIRR